VSFGQRQDTPKRHVGSWNEIAHDASWAAQTGKHLLGTQNVSEQNQNRNIFVSATNVARAGKRGNVCVGNNVSATMCPRLPGPLETTFIKLQRSFDQTSSKFIGLRDGFLSIGHFRITFSLFLKASLGACPFIYK